MPLFDEKKTIDEILGTIGIIGVLFFLFFMFRFAFSHPPLLLVTLILSPIIPWIWMKFRIAILNDYEIKFVSTCVFIVSIVVSFLIFQNKGKVEVYSDQLFLQGRQIKYREWVEDDYSDNHYTPAHYEYLYRFEIDDTDEVWLQNTIEWVLLILCIGVPIFNYGLMNYSFNWANEKEKMDNYKNYRRLRLEEILK